MVLVVPKPGRPKPGFFKEPGRPGIFTALPFLGPDAARPELERLDEALRHYAPEKYRRAASLNALLGL
ncbi:hypothetical protein ACFC0D_32010 [Streptomyces sp. NPDC056222]|uniref:hypothetical protein n=1 Tax=Streptomyces sp. NPDC056222 TaxID=3345749 RepID=UPI0035E2869F